MKRNLLMIPAAVAGFAACGEGAPAAKEIKTKPNIIFILADDMGIGDLGCYGQKLIETPNIDRLAQDGLRFTHHYSGSTVSAPSRCSLLTGKDMGHAWIRGNAGTSSGYDCGLRPEDTTVAELLKAQGYATGCVGKWGLGGPDSDGRPGLKGFDYFFGYLSQGAAHNYYPDYLFENNEKVYLGGEVYSHFLIMEKGLNFMKEHIDEPLFMYFAITPPHADLDYPDISHYDGKFEETPWVNNPKSGRGYKSNPKPRATYAAMVSEIDKNVGMVIDLLEKEGKLDNSIIIFSSDNGVHCVGGHDPDYFDCNGPFRGYKRDLYEGGIRTPFIVRWPGVIAPGSETDAITTFWDFLPTACEIAGAQAPSDIQGISYLPTLLGKKQRKTHDYIYYEFYEKGGKQSIMTTKDGWKLVRLNMDKPEKMVEELYNINDDIAEGHDRIKEYPEKADFLRELMGYARTPNPNFKWKSEQ